MSEFERIALRSLHDQAAIPALRYTAHGERRGAIVVIQEIFGVTDHVSEICAAFAAAGFDALAPALFARIDPDFHAAPDLPGIAKGKAAVAATPWTQAMGDVQAAINALPRPCFIAGFCYGGAIAWRAAGACDGLAAASCFYGRLIIEMRDIAPKIPVMLHYGARDPTIPPADIVRVRAARPEAQIHIYDGAGHGFCRRGGADYDARAHHSAFERTLELFAAAAH